MPGNVEIKARVDDLEHLKTVATQLSGETVTVLEQEDVFFNVPNGRLKLRKIKGSHAELIYYERSDQEGPKFSDFTKTQTNDPDGLQETLSRSIGVKGQVKKTRLLYMVGQTRVHVDAVEGLGDFMELEVMLKSGQSVEEGQQIAEDLMSKLGVRKDQLINCAYMDLLLKQNKS